jgi:aryl-alcohol dehydrogenase-like predicted oxidoreductase
VESGINWIDAAAVYGLGHSEEVVGAALAGLPQADQPYVFTKGGLVSEPADRPAEPRRTGGPASIRTEVEASLRRLRTERIDLYQMHWRPRTAHHWRNTDRSSRRRVTVWRLAAVPDFLLASSRYGGLP